MSSLKLRFTIVLTIISLILIGWTLTDNRAERATNIELNNEEPSYQSQHMVTLAYEPSGHLGSKLVSDEVKHYSAKKETWFTLPVLTMYDIENKAIWRVKAKRAKLSETQMLYLFDDVEVNNLAANSQLKRITTDNAEINLTTQDITTDDRVVLSGLNFSSTGIKLRGNLRNKSAELLEQVVTNYLPSNNNDLRK